MREEPLVVTRHLSFVTVFKVFSVALVLRVALAAVLLFPGGAPRAAGLCLQKEAAVALAWEPLASEAPVGERNRDALASFPALLNASENGLHFRELYQMTCCLL